MCSLILNMAKNIHIKIEIAKEQMEIWKSATDNFINFIEIKDNGWNRFTWGIGCNYHICISSSSDPSASGSSIGYIPWSNIKMSQNALKGSYLHELGHVLGLQHEMKRYDRDKYTIIYYSNIQRGYEHNFWKLASTTATPYGDFDYKSIMMYSSKSFAKDKTKPTITTIEGGIIEESYELSSCDKLNIKHLYHK